MKNSGKKLEELVAQIENILLPENFTIHKNIREYDDKGVCTNEFDIIFEGKVGSGYYKGLIECRDRQSQGKAPKSWIEQLLGRQQVGKFNKVIAVSSTGFSPGAIELANKFGIEIHVLSEIKIDQISDWFQVQKLFLSKPIITLEKCTIYISEDTNEELRLIFKRILSTLKLDDLVFHFKSNENKFSLNQLFIQAFNSYYKSINTPIPEQDHVSIDLIAEYPNEYKHYFIVTDKGNIRINQILFIGELNNKIDEVPLVNITKYSNLSVNEDIATSVKYNFQVNNTEHEVSFHHKNDTNEVVLVLKTLDQ